jgi:hypothetical protein
MTTIKATGKKSGKDLDIVCEVDGDVIDFTFNGQKNIGFELEILFRTNQTAIGGTYWPQTLPLQIVAVLRNGFFDRDPDITVEGDLEEIPEPAEEKGAIY